MSDFPPIDLINQRVAEGYIRTQHHPDLPLRIFNYTQKTQYEGMWDEATTICRGLILEDNTNQVVARPFPKFFNWGELTPEERDRLEHETPMYVQDKVDGSLGIVYHYNDRWHVATRGSFTSEQALWAISWLQNNIGLSGLEPSITYLTEIVYPANRIVVNYGEDEGLFGLAGMHIATGKSLMRPPGLDRFLHVPDIFVPHIDAVFDTVNTMKDGEGVVVFWPDIQYRVKIKREEYVRLHRLVFGLTKRSVWDLLRNNEHAQILELRAQLPEELLPWLDETVLTLENVFGSILTSARIEFADILNKLGLEMGSSVAKDQRRNFALLAKESLRPHLLFMQLDDKPIADLHEAIWKELRPGHEPARVDVDHE